MVGHETAKDTVASVTDGFNWSAALQLDPL